MEDWGAHPHKDTVFEKLLLELQDLLWVGVLELSLDQLAISPNKVEGSKETSHSTLSEAVVLLEHTLHARGEDLLHLLDMADNVVVDHVSHRLISSDAADRVSLVGCAPTEGVSSEEILNVLSEADGREREVRARETLCDGEDIGDHSIVGLEGEHFTTSADASHNLISDHENVVLVAKCSNALDNLRGVHKYTSGASN